MRILSNIRLLLISLWLGASVFFIGVAQTAFSVLQERELAGAIVGRTLAILNYSGLVIALILLAMTLIGQKHVNKLWLWIERFALAILAAACAVGQFVIAFWILLVKDQMGKPLDQIAADDPLRIQFNALHQYSEWILLSGMVAAVIVFFIIANRQPASAKKDNVVDFDFQDQFKM